MSGTDPQDTNDAGKTASQKLAELVAERKAAAGHGKRKGQSTHRDTERVAAALSASRSKPAPRKG